MDASLRSRLDLVHRSMVEYYGEEFLVEDRSMPNTERRQLFAWAVHCLVPEARTVDVGEYMGRCHSIVSHSVNKICDLRCVYSSFRDESEKLLSHIQVSVELDGLGLLSQRGYEV